MDASYAHKVGAIREEEDARIVVKVYRKRWLMLLLYIIFAALVSGQWGQYCIIANVVSRYYDVSSIAVDCTSLIFMLCYMLFVVPTFYLSERYGLRWTLMIGSALCCAGAVLKIFSVAPDRFALAMAGQAIVAVSVVVLQTTPSKLAANWFGSDEQSTATSLGIFGPQLGNAFAFLLTPVIVKNREQLDDVGADLAVMYWCVAVPAVVSLLLIVFLFQEEPEVPPSETRYLQKRGKDGDDEHFKEPMRRLFTNKSFLILCNSYGLNVGILNALSTLLNQLFLIHFKDGEEDAGRIGLIIVLIGMLGSITFGVILDKTHKFKQTAVTVYFLSLCGQILFSAAMFLEIKWLVYVASVFLGFFMPGYLALGYELAAEYTYPESENHSASLLNVNTNLYGIVLILIFGQVLQNYGDVPVHAIFCVILFVGFVMTALTRDEKRRQDARRAAIERRAELPEVLKKL